MLKIKFALPSLIVMICLCAIQNTHAYDEDTHFYGTYSMARFAGINQKVALKIALSAQWMDESFMSDPTSLMFLPLTGVKKRRLLHFPASRVAGTLSSKVQLSEIGAEEFTGFKKTIVEYIAKFSGAGQPVDTINFFTKTKEADRFATEMLSEGLNEGNLMKAAASLHVLEDSFAHAGTPAEEGHRSFWHWPDRPFDSYKKYDRMVQSVMAAMVAIREMLPPQALDCNLKALPKKNTPNCMLPYPVLHAAYVKLPEVQQTVSYNVLKDPEYVKTAMDDFYVRAIDAKYFNTTKEEYDALVAANTASGQDTPYEVLTKLISALLKMERTQRRSIFNLPYVLDDTGQFGDSTKLNPTTPTQPPLAHKDRPDTPTIGQNTLADLYKYIDAHNFDTEDGPSNNESHFEFAKSLAYDLLRWNVPLKLDEFNRIEIENDKGIIRKKEMEIRIRNMQKLISQLYGENIQFIENHTKDEAGFGKEFYMNPEAEPTIPNQPGVVYATFDLAEKHQWNNMIFHYVLPTMTDKDFSRLVKFGAKIFRLEKRYEEYQKKQSEVEASDMSKTQKWLKSAQLFVEYGDVSDFVSRMANYEWLLNSGIFEYFKDSKGSRYFKDVLGKRLVADEHDQFYGNMFYRSSNLVQEMKENGRIKPLLQENTDPLWNIKKLNLQ